MIARLDEFSQTGAVSGVGVLRPGATRAALVPLRWPPGPRAVPGVRSGTVLRPG